MRYADHVKVEVSLFLLVCAIMMLSAWETGNKFFMPKADGRADCARQTRPCNTAKATTQSRRLAKGMTSLPQCSCSR